MTKGPQGSFPCGSSFAAFRLVQSRMVLFDGLLLMRSPSARGGAAISHHILDRAAAALPCGQLAAADVLADAAREVIGLAHIGHVANCVAHPVFTGFGGRLLSNAGGRVVLGRATGFVDCHVMASFDVSIFRITERQRRFFALVLL